MNGQPLSISSNNSSAISVNKQDTLAPQKLVDKTVNKPKKAPKKAPKKRAPKKKTQSKGPPTNSEGIPIYQLTQKYKNRTN
jgi:hypothetical protein